VLGSVPEAGKVSLVAAFSPDVNKKGLEAGKFIGKLPSSVVVVAADALTSLKPVDATPVSYQKPWKALEFIYIPV
jgi:hypothetical protein